MSLQFFPTVILVTVLPLGFAWASPTISGLEAAQKPVLETDTKKPASLPVLKNFAMALDLNSCKCQGVNEPCQVAISKSMLLEIKCRDDQHFCCKVLRHRPSGASIRPTPRVKIHVLTPDYVPVASEPTPTTSTALSSMPRSLPNPTVDKKRLKCRCTARDQCAESKTDYSFGFYCSYDKVRCCDVVDNSTAENDHSTFLTNISEGRGLVTSASNNANNNGRSSMIVPSGLIQVDKTEVNEKKNCQCVPATECVVPNRNPNDDVPDTQGPCPFRFVQCCSSSQQTDTHQQVSEKSDAQVDTIVTRVGSQDTISRDPIQLPLLKIPLTESKDGDVVIGGEQMHPTMAPPQLPTYYNYQPPNYHSGYYYPTSVSEERQPAVSYNYNPTGYHGRPSWAITGKKKSSSSIMDTLAGLFGRK